MAYDLNGVWHDPVPAGTYVPPSSTGGASNLANGSTLSQFWDSYSGKNNYRAPDVTYDYGRSFEDRANQQQAVQNTQPSMSYYQGLMQGTQPSLAQRQMNQGINQAQANAIQQASASRGVDRSAAMRNAINASANAGTQGAIAGGNLRLQEQQVGAGGAMQGAVNQGSMYGAMRGQDVSEQQNLQALQTQRYGINAGITGQNAAGSAKATGGIMQMGGAALAAMFSDENLKEEAKIDDSASKYPAIKQLMSDERNKSGIAPWSTAVEPYKFQYNDDFSKQKATLAAQQTYAQVLEDAKRPRAGVMAQDLASSPNTQDMVIQTPAGLAIDKDRALGHLMAGQSDLNQRLADLEREKNARRAPLAGPTGER